MSYTEIFAFNPDGTAESIGEIRNAHRGAMAVWNHFEQKYLPEARPAWATQVMAPGYWSRFGMGSDEEMQEFWDLIDDPRLTLSERIVLGSTYDNVVVMREDLPRLIAAFRAFEGQSSLPEQADLIMQVLDTTDLIAIGWNQTSVNSDSWENYHYDEETEESTSYNLLTGTAHLDLFKDLIEGRTR